MHIDIGCSLVVDWFYGHVATRIDVSCTVLRSFVSYKVTLSYGSWVSPPQNGSYVLPFQLDAIAELKLLNIPGQH